MYSLETDGRLQVTSAISLLEFSRLVHGDDNSAQFIPAQQWEFELSWNESVWPVFGRLICWISFSAGAEFLAKGFCLLNEIDVRQPHSVPANPTGELKVWVARYFDNPDASTQQTTNFGDLNALVSLKDKNNKGKFLRQLCKKKAASPKDEELVLVAYDFLRRTIRNRDAHAYRPNVRDDNFHLVPELFVKSFNILLAWIPGGGTQLSEWRDNAGAFVNSVPKKHF
jgi:hypothetical protein